MFINKKSITQIIDDKSLHDVKKKTLQIRDNKI